MSTANLNTGKGWGELLAELVFLRIREGERGYYYGAMQLGEDAIWDGLGQFDYPASIGKADPVTLAHELGHNMSLRHAPCGGAIAADMAYPYNGGAIGAWGYDFEQERIVSASLYKDLMGYCEPEWISDYHFARAMGFRLFREALVMGNARAGDVAAAGPGGTGDWLSGPAAQDGGTYSPATAQKTLLLWGRAGLGELVLDPAFVVDAPVSLPTEDGPYRLEGHGPAGERRFSLSFAICLTRGGTCLLGAIRPIGTVRFSGVLSGPEGSHTLERFGSTPMAMVTERGSGKLKAVLRDWDGAWPPGLTLSASEAEIVVSEGLPH